MRGNGYESGDACRSYYATDRRSTSLALTPVFRATVMTSVAMDIPMRLLGTWRRMPARRWGIPTVCAVTKPASSHHLRTLLADAGCAPVRS